MHLLYSFRLEAIIGTKQIAGGHECGRVSDSFPRLRVSRTMWSPTMPTALVSVRPSTGASFFLSHCHGQIRNEAYKIKAAGV